MAWDICASSVPESSKSEVSSSSMRAAVRRGFDPLAVQSIDTSLEKRVAGTLKLDAPTTYRYWKELVREQHRPWRLCEACSTAFAQSTRITPMAPGQPSAWQKRLGPVVRPFQKKTQDFGLVEWAAKGNVPLVVALLLRGLDPDVSDLGDAPPVLMAAVNGHNNVVKTLMAAGARVDAEARAGATALMLTALRGNADVVLTLLQGVPMRAPRTRTARPRLC